MACWKPFTRRSVYSRRSLIRNASMVVVDANLAPPAIDSLLRQALKHRVPVSADPTSPRSPDASSLTCPTCL